jgi:hypothetical protein
MTAVLGFEVCGETGGQFTRQMAGLNSAENADDVKERAAPALSRRDFLSIITPEFIPG